MCYLPDCAYLSLIIQGNVVIYSVQSFFLEKIIYSMALMRLELSTLNYFVFIVYFVISRLYGTNDTNPNTRHQRRNREMGCA